MTGSELRAALRRLGLTQVEAARRLGVSQGAISDWIRGRRAVPGPIALVIRCWLRHRKARTR